MELPLSPLLMTIFLSFFSLVSAFHSCLERLGWALRVGRWARSSLSSSRSPSVKGGRYVCACMVVFEGLKKGDFLVFVVSVGVVLFDF